MTRDTDSSWAEAQAHLLAQPMSDALRAWIASDTPYRPVYGGPEHGPRTHPRVPEPWKALCNQPPYVGASMGAVCLVWLAREFAAALVRAEETPR